MPHDPHRHDDPHGHHGHGQGHGPDHAAGAPHDEPMPWEFDEEKLEKLRDPARLELMPPDAIWDVLAARVARAGRPFRVLVDLGTGIGFFALPFARRLGGGLIYACDTSAEALAYLREALRREGVPGVVPVLAEAVRVPLADSIADAMVMINLHHHLPSRPGTLAECRRLLRPGGVLGAIDWQPMETEKGPPLEHRFAPAAVQAELEAAGFQDVAGHDIMPQHWFLTGYRDT